MSSNAESISEYMKKTLSEFELIRGKSRQFFPYPFWDIVVITTSDNLQKKAFEIQINSKIDRGELPLDIPYHVISDPPGPKIGSGGSTIIALQSLLMMYGEKLFTFKILLIHAGGQCQRIPSHSILGKLFAPLPLGKPMFQMLELVLAMYWPFTKRMDAGVFLVSSDAIITYHLPDEDDSDTSWTFQNCGFTALAHPSSLEIGTTHGVYVLPPLSSSSLQKSCFITPCLEVLQKPSIQTMRDKGAIIKSNANAENSDEIVYSDSAFFFSSSIVNKFIDYIQSGNSITCELDAYGDFLQGLGTQASSSYVYNTNNVADVSDNLIQTRENIYHLLKESALHVVVLQKSNFYHIGTMKEYTENICSKEIFASELRLEKNVFSIHSVTGLISTSIDGIVMHSCLHPTSVIPKTTVIEYCDLPVVTEIGQDSIISGCSAFGEKISEVPLQIPPGCLIHTIAIRVDNINGYVTLAFSRDDDLKKKYPLRDLTNMKYFGKCLSDIPRKIFGCDKYTDLFNTNAEKCSLWQAKLFQMQLTMEDSLKITLNMIENVLNQSDPFEGFCSISIFPRLSMEEILKYRDIDRTIDYRNRLWHKITELRSESCNEKDSQ